MLRTCGRRLIVALSGVAALTWLGAGLAIAESAPVFARIAVSEWSVVYVQIQDGELRAAMSIAGLQTAEPVKMRSLKAGSFDSIEYALPIPANQLPAGITAIKANLAHATAQVRTKTGVTPLHLIVGHLAVCRTDDRKAEWEYVSDVNAQAGSYAENAPLIRLPNPDNVRASVEARASAGKLAVGLRVMAGGVELAEVRKDGQSVQAKMTVASAWGAVTASKIGPLSAFGFS